VTCAGDVLPGSPKGALPATFTATYAGRVGFFDAAPTGADQQAI